MVWPGSAAEALAFLDRSYAAWKAGVDSLDEAALARAIGPAEGPWHEHPMAALICHINREVLHHGRERHGERLRELAHRRRAEGQLLHHASPRRIGQRLEHQIELVRLVKHSLKYRRSGSQSMLK